jgi:hypothetical protein
MGDATKSKSCGIRFEKPDGHSVFEGSRMFLSFCPETPAFAGQSAIEESVSNETASIHASEMYAPAASLEIFHAQGYVTVPQVRFDAGFSSSLRGLGGGYRIPAPSALDVISGSGSAPHTFSAVDSPNSCIPSTRHVPSLGTGGDFAYWVHNPKGTREYAHFKNVDYVLSMAAQQQNEGLRGEQAQSYGAAAFQQSDGHSRLVSCSADSLTYSFQHQASRLQEVLNPAPSPILSGIEQGWVATSDTSGVESNSETDPHQFLDLSAYDAQSPDHRVWYCEWAGCKSAPRPDETLIAHFVRCHPITDPELCQWTNCSNPHRISSRSRPSPWRHIETHARSEQYSCSICSAVFGRSDNRARHVKMTHS